MKQYTFKLTDQTHQQLKHLAGAYNFTQGEIVSFLIEAEYNALQNRPRLSRSGRVDDRPPPDLEVEPDLIL